MRGPWYGSFLVGRTSSSPFDGTTPAATLTRSTLSSAPYRELHPGTALIGAPSAGTGPSAGSNEPPGRTVFDGSVPCTSANMSQCLARLK